MILHELFFGSLGDESAPEDKLRHRLTLHFGALTAGAVLRNGQSQAGGSGWVGSPGRSATQSSSISGDEPHDDAGR